ncbi:hypothetical protein G6F59_018228 [Rhizopus arrhizus]|nr:hypothetical protein G6F59_018228 [Rhizopus arrhizus]
MRPRYSAGGRWTAAAAGACTRKARLRKAARANPSPTARSWISSAATMNTTTRAAGSSRTGRSASSCAWTPPRSSCA